TSDQWLCQLFHCQSAPSAEPAANERADKAIDLTCFPNSVKVYDVMVEDSPLDEFAVVINLVSDRVLMRDRIEGVTFQFRGTLENDFTAGTILDREDGCTRVPGE